MWSNSSSGPHLLACAALLPDLVAAAASLASLAPADAEGLDWFERMVQHNVDHSSCCRPTRNGLRQAERPNASRFSPDVDDLPISTRPC